MSEDEELRMIRTERDALLAAVTTLLDNIGDTEKGSVTFEGIRKRFAPWERKDRVFCTCKLPGLAYESTCPVDHWR